MKFVNIWFRRYEHDCVRKIVLVRYFRFTCFKQYRIVSKNKYRRLYSTACVVIANYVVAVYGVLTSETLLFYLPQNYYRMYINIYRYIKQNRRYCIVKRTRRRGELLALLYTRHLQFSNVKFNELPE